MSCQIAKTEDWKIMIKLSDTKYCHLAIHYVLPKILPGPNLHFRFMKNCIHTSPLGSLCHYQLPWLNEIFLSHWMDIFKLLLTSIWTCQLPAHIKKSNMFGFFVLWCLHNLYDCNSFIIIILPNSHQLCSFSMAFLDSNIKSWYSV